MDIENDMSKISYKIECLKNKLKSVDSFNQIETEEITKPSRQRHDRWNSINIVSYQSEYSEQDLEELVKYTHKKQKSKHYYFGSKFNYNKDLENIKRLDFLPYLILPQYKKNIHDKFNNLKQEKSIWKRDSFYKLIKTQTSPSTASRRYGLVLNTSMKNPLIDKEMDFKYEELKAMNFNKLENASKEDYLQKSMNFLTTKMSSIEKELNTFRKEIESMKNEKNDCEIEQKQLEMNITKNALNNDQCYTDSTRLQSENNSEVKNKRKYKKKTTKHLKKIEEENLNSKLSLLKQIQQNKEKLDKKLETLKDQREILENTISNFQLKCLDMERQLEKMRVDFKKYKNMLILHYHLLLQDGNDVRSDGLSWIIKAIWQLNTNVMVSFFPHFLDKENIEYLFLSSHYCVLLKEFDLLLSEIKTKFAKTKQTTSISHKNEILFMINEVKKELRHVLKANELHRYDSIFGDKLYLMELKEQMISVEKIKSEIKSKLSSLYYYEIDRIVAQLSQNDYIKNLEVPLENLISSLFGKDHKDKVMKMISQNIETYKNNILKCRSYEIKSLKHVWNRKED